jgi:uracil-DNA glycosylase family 4
MQDDRRSLYLEAMGIQHWVSRKVTVTADSPVTGVHAAAVAPQADWSILQQAVAGCTRCALHESRTQTVFGTGDRDAEWFIVGEAPGADEDRQGEPFVGRAGQLLNEMLFAAGFSREQVYIANILKCRPPGNRNPLPQEVSCCIGYLQQQLALVRPRLILAVGGIAANSLLQADASVGELRGKVHHFGAEQLPVVVTYHPAYLLRSPMEKRKAWLDLQFARRVYRDAAVH